MKKRIIVIVILITYIAALIKIMVFKDIPVIRIGAMMLKFGGTQEGAANLIPFKTILPYLLGEKGLMIAFINIAGNIALLVPIGFLVPFVYQKMTWKKTIALAVASGFAIEGMQAVLHVGIFDIDDVILNALGVIAGYWSYLILANWLRSGKYKTVIITSIIIAAAALVALYAIYPKARQPVNAIHDTGKVQPDPIDTVESKITEGADPCNGTGGTGQIVSVGNKTITIKRNDGINQIIKLTDRTDIRNSLGAIAESDLKTGYRVTVVIDGSETATVVVVCNVTGTEKGK